MVMTRDGGMKPISTQGTHSAPQRRWEMLGTPPNSLPPLGGGVSDAGFDAVGWQRAGLAGTQPALSHGCREGILITLLNIS